VSDGDLSPPCREYLQKRIVSGLTVHEEKFVILVQVFFLEEDEGDFEQANHGAVVEPSNGADDSDGRGLDLVPEESLEGESGADGVRIGIDGDEDMILELNVRVEFLESLFGGSSFPGSSRARARCGRLFHGHMRGNTGTNLGVL